MANKVWQNSKQEYVIEFNGNTKILSFMEGQLLQEYMRRRSWEVQIEEEIDAQCEFIKFPYEDARKEFVAECVDECQTQWENLAEQEPNIADIVYDKAEEYEYWEE